jgi:hypothetical protein
MLSGKFCSSRGIGIRYRGKTEKPGMRERELAIYLGTSVSSPYEYALDRLCARGHAVTPGFNCRGIFSKFLHYFVLIV